MGKLFNILFCFFSVVLITTLLVACVSVGKGTSNDSKDESAVDSSVSQVLPDSSAVESEETEEESLAPESSEDSTVEESSEKSSEEPSEEESSEEESVSVPESTLPDDSSTVVDVGSTDPIVIAPSSLSASPLDAYFDDGLFVGHSVMYHFNNRVTTWRNDIDPGILGDALLCPSVSFGFYNNAHQTPETADNVLPKYRGVAYNIEDLPAATGKSTLYIGLMGLNDLGMVGNGETCARLVADIVIECIETIAEESPDTRIVLLASTYLTRTTSYTNLNNRNMSRLNAYMLEYCNANGIDFIDVATPLTDGDGYLAKAYSSDDYCHLREKAYFIWMEALRDYASRKMDGTWQNPASIPLFGE